MFWLFLSLLFYLNYLESVRESSIEMERLRVIEKAINSGYDLKEIHKLLDGDTDEQ